MNKIYCIAVLFCFQSVTLNAADLSGAADAGSDLGAAKSHIEKKDWSAAISTLEKFIKANPNNADGYNLLGYSLRNAKRYSESIFNYKEALRIDPQHRGHTNTWAWLMCKIKNCPKPKNCWRHWKKFVANNARNTKT